MHILPKVSNIRNEFIFNKVPEVFGTHKKKQYKILL